MFKFRGQRKDNGEWVVGWLVLNAKNFGREVAENHWYIVPIERVYLCHEIHPHTLSISTGKLDSNGTEIFASFEIDGTMTEGGDVVRTTLWGEAVAVYESGDNCAFKLNTINSSLGYIGGFPSESLTIIGKGGAE